VAGVVEASRRVTGPLMSVNDRLPKPFELARLYEMVARWTAA